MDLIDQLQKDRQQVTNLFKVIADTPQSSPATRQDRFKKLRSLLEAHSGAVEEVIYSSLAKKPECHDQIIETLEHRRMLQALMGKISDLPPDSAKWLGQLTNLKEAFEQYAEVEQDIIQNKAGDLFDPGSVQFLTERFHARKNKILKDGIDENSFKESA